MLYAAVGLEVGSEIHYHLGFVVTVTIVRCTEIYNLPSMINLAIYWSENLTDDRETSSRVMLTG